MLGRDLQFEELGHDEAREDMLALGHGDAADWLLDGDRRMIDNPQPVLATVPDLLGRPSTTFAAWVRANTEAFRSLT